MNDITFLRLIAATVLAKQNTVLITELSCLRAENSYLHEPLPKDHTLRFTDPYQIPRRVVCVGEVTRSADWRPRRCSGIGHCRRVAAS
jgi:hypothetical protein